MELLLAFAPFTVFVVVDTLIGTTQGLIAGAAWNAEPRAMRGRQPCYSGLAIAAALTLRAVFRLALRQTEGLIGSIIALLGLDLARRDGRAAATC